MIHAVNCVVSDGRAVVFGNIERCWAEITGRHNHQQCVLEAKYLFRYLRALVPSYLVYRVKVDC